MPVPLREWEKEESKVVGEKENMFACMHVHFSNHARQRSAWHSCLWVCVCVWTGPVPASLLQESWGQRFESLVPAEKKTVCNEQFAAEHCGNAGVWMEALIVMFSGLCMHVYSVERLYVAFYLWFLLFSVCSYLILEYYKWLSKKCLQYWQLLFIYFFKYFKLSL